MILDDSLWCECVADLTARYSAPVRFYHNLSHVQDCLAELSAIPDTKIDHRELIEVALWFHDAIYDATRSDNEAASADLAAEWLEKMNVPHDKIGHVKKLIQITDHRAEPQTPDETLIVDIDLSILGRDSEIYSRYASAIRQEYADVPEKEYRAGRAEVLRGFLERDQIFRTEFFRGKYEAVARRNIESEIGNLR